MKSTPSLLKTMSKMTRICSDLITLSNSFNGLLLHQGTRKIGCSVWEVERKTSFLVSSLEFQFIWMSMASQSLWLKSTSSVFIKIWEPRDWLQLWSKKLQEESTDATFGKLFIQLELLFQPQLLKLPTGTDHLIQRSLLKLDSVIYHKELLWPDM